VQRRFKIGWNFSKKILLTIPTCFDYSTTLMNIIETFTSTPLLVTLQHCWQAFIAIAPAFGLLGLTFLIAKK
jgi:hypothetical protein